MTPKYRNLEFQNGAVERRHRRRLRFVFVCSHNPIGALRRNSESIPRPDAENLPKLVLFLPPIKTLENVSKC
jgi:hypothetical protein